MVLTFVSDVGSMMNMNESNAPITLDAPVFPYLVKDDAATHTSYITIEHEEMYRDDERTLFYVVGAEMDIRTKDPRMTTETSIKIYHSFARDFEASRSVVANLTIRSLTLSSAYGKSLVFTGWLTRALFYPDGAVDRDGELVNPFIDAEKQPDGDGYGNAHYPYLPPVVTFGKALQLPIPVTITLHHNQKSDLLEKLDSYMDGHAKARAEREAKAEAERLEREKRHEKHLKWEKEWLKSEEGQIHLAERKVFASMRNAAPTAEVTDEEKAAIQAQAVVDFAQFTDEEKTLLLKGQPNRRKIPRSDVGGRAYMEKFEFLLSQK